MRLTRFTDNALRCLIALHRAGGQPLTTGAIARQMHMSEDHLSKVVQRLVQLGYVGTVRGRNGGVRLLQAPSAIVIGALIRATEDNLVLVECFDPVWNACPIAAVCKMAPALDQALNAFLTVLDGYTLADFALPPPVPG